MTADSFELSFSSIEALHDWLLRTSSAGIDEFLAKIAGEFTSGRHLVVGDSIWIIDAVAVRRLRGTTPVERLLDFAEHSRPENSRLTLTVNVLGSDPSIQLVVRSRPDSSVGVSAHEVV